MARRFRRKDLKRPDEFVTAGRRLLEWTQQNSRRAYQLGGAFVAVLVVVGAFYSLRGARARQANEDLAQALSGLRAGHYAEATTQLADVATRWQSTGPGRVAKLLAAGAALKANNYETVTTLLADVPESADWPVYLRQQALVTLAFALEQKGDAKAAAGRYAEAAGLSGPFEAEALLGEARCRQQLGESDAARQLYERFAHEFPQAAELEGMNLRID
jgi:tetratricopeptide (TPR) repeat protein